MLSQFCIRRPIFASVMSILIVIAGLLAGRVLPMGQYPDITPPVVFISTSYEGADAQTLAKTVAAPIEDQLSGVEGLLITKLPSVRTEMFVLPARSKSVQIRTTRCWRSITACDLQKDGCRKAFDRTA